MTTTTKPVAAVLLTLAGHVVNGTVISGDGGLDGGRFVWPHHLTITAVADAALAPLPEGPASGVLDRLTTGVRT